MKRIVLAVAALGFLGAAVASAAPKANHPAAREIPPTAMQDQSNPQPQVQTFTGMITKSGDKFLFSDASSNASYMLDDQQAARKFDGKKVKVTGTLDAANNLIRVQSIELASA